MEINHEFDHRWHVALNRYMMPSFYGQPGSPDRHAEAGWMYEAKHLAEESARLVHLFKMEREGTLPKTHRQCSFSETVPVADNHLTCCLGKACRECPMLLALADQLEGAELDTAHAWTCVTHIVQECARHPYGIDTSEGYVLTTDDRMFWDTVYHYMAMPEDPDQPNMESRA